MENYITGLDEVIVDRANLALSDDEQTSQKAIREYIDLANLEFRVKEAEYKRELSLAELNFKERELQYKQQVDDLNRKEAETKRELEVEATRKKEQRETLINVGMNVLKISLFCGLGIAGIIFEKSDNFTSTAGKSIFQQVYRLPFNDIFKR